MVRQVQTQTSKDEIAEFLKEVTETAILYGFRVESLEVVSDHVHVLVSATPQHTIPNMVKMRYFCQEAVLKVSQLKKNYGVDIFGTTYFVSTISENTEAQVRSISNSSYKVPYGDLLQDFAQNDKSSESV